MAHHAYYVVAEGEEGVAASTTFLKRSYGLVEGADLQIHRYGLFSTDDARRVLAASALAPTTGEVKAVVLVVERLFHETQNILLKSFEEPEGGTVFILVLPSEGVLIPTLRSRLLPLPGVKKKDEEEGMTRAQVEKEVAEILAQSKKDAADDKQAARAKALALVQRLTRRTYGAYKEKESPALRAFLTDLDAFTPLLHERAAPLKPILEHVLLVMPAKV